MARPVLFLGGNLTDITTTNYESGTCCTKFTLECTSGCWAGMLVPCEAWGKLAHDVAQLASALFVGELMLGRTLLISEWLAD
jgi:hypothetical protein